MTTPNQPGEEVEEALRAECCGCFVGGCTDSKTCPLTDLKAEVRRLRVELGKCEAGEIALSEMERS